MYCWSGLNSSHASQLENNEHPQTSKNLLKIMLVNCGGGIDGTLHTEHSGTIFVTVFGRVRTCDKDSLFTHSWQQLAKYLRPSLVCKHFARPYMLCWTCLVRSPVMCGLNALWCRIQTNRHTAPLRTDLELSDLARTCGSWENVASMF